MGTAPEVATRPDDRLRRAALALLALTAAGTLGVMVWSAGGPADHLSADGAVATVLLTAWALAPIAAAAALHLLVHRTWPRGRAATAR